MRTITTILLLEDMESDQLLIQRVLKQAGIQAAIQVCDNKSDYSFYIENNHIDMILADFHVPGFDSYDALQISRSNNILTPFVFVTGSVPAELAADTVINEADAYVLKDNLIRLPTVIQELWKSLQPLNRALEEREKIRLLSEKFDLHKQKLEAILKNNETIV